MRKIKPYILVLIVAVLIHVYLVTEIRLQNYDLLNLWSRLYLPLLFSTISFLFIYIIYTQSRDKSASYLISFLLAGSTTFLASSESGLENVVAKIILNVTFPLTAYLFCRFIFETLVNKRIIKRQKAKTEKFYVLTLLLIIGLNSLNLFIYHDIFNDVSRTLFILYFVLHISLPMIKIIQLLISKQQVQKSFLMWMLFIPTVSFGPFTFLHALPSLFGEPTIDPYFTTLAFLAIPVGYTYLILTKKLLNLKFIFNRVIYYSSIAIIPTILISFILVYTVTELSIANLLIVFITLYIFHIAFLFLKEQFDFYLRHTLFQDKNNTVQFIERIAKGLSKVKTKKQLEKFIITKIKKYLNNVHVTIFTYNHATTHVETDHLFIPTRLDDSNLRGAIQNNEGKTFIQHDNSIGLFLFQQQNVAHYLWVEKANDYSGFNVREKSLLIIFISYVKLVCENIMMNEHYVQKLIDNTEQASVSKSRFLFHMAEQERKRLATDIHDTLLQELIFMYRKLIELNGDNQLELREMEITLKKVIEKTRQTCSELIPSTLLTQGLSAALKERIKLSKERAYFHLTYEIDIMNDINMADEKLLAIYRVVEELLNNAEKHSHANRVSIYVWESEGKLFIDYLDDGVGFSYEEEQSNGQIGLRSMVERIKSIDGKIEFEAEKHVKIYITIPG